MINNIFANNILFIKNYFPQFYDYLQSVKNTILQDINFEIEMINDLPAIICKSDKLKTFNINSRFNPLKEFERIAATEYSDSVNAYFITEFFGGYETELLLKLAVEKKIKIYYFIFFPQLFLKLIELIDITFLKKYDIAFVFGENTAEFNESLKNANIHTGESRIIARQNIIELLNSIDKYKPITDYLKRKSMSKNFGGKFGGIIEKNLIKNKQFITYKNGIAALKKKKILKLRFWSAPVRR